MDAEVRRWGLGVGVWVLGVRDYGLGFGVWSLEVQASFLKVMVSV